MRRARQISETEAGAGEPVAVVEQPVDIIEQLVGVLHGLTQNPAIRRRAVDKPLFHAFVEQRPDDLHVELLIEPGGQSANFGAVGRSARDHRGLVDGFFQIFADRI